MLKVYTRWHAIQFNAANKMHVDTIKGADFDRRIEKKGSFYASVCFKTASSNHSNNHVIVAYIKSLFSLMF